MTVVADDGRELRATRFEPVTGREGARGAVVLVPAMATPARFYTAFATWLAESGFHVLTFDYRGTGSVEEMKAERGDVLRWAGDAASALESLLDENLGLPVTWIGHSLGGQLLPFARHDLLDRALMIATGSGYWRYNQGSLRWRAPLFLRVVAPLAMRVAGYYPGRRLGLLGDAPSAAPTTPAPPTEVGEASFVSPSGNIGCYLDKSGARCDIIRKDWQPPPAPADCDLDWGAGLSVSRSDEARFTCAGDTVLGGKDKLAYGKSLRAGDFTCSSDRKAMRCENTESGHGFTLATRRW